MAWIDSMRFRGRADKVRAVGWVNLLLTLVWTLLNVDEGPGVLAIAFGWGAGVMALTHGAGWALDTHAERVVRR